MRKTATAWLLVFALASVAQAAQVELESGDVLIGEIVEDNEDGIVLDHPLLGRITIPRADLKPPDPPEPPNPGLFGTSFMEGWKRNISAGMSGAAGNTSNFNIDIQMKLENKTERHRQNWLTAFFYATNAGSTSTNRFLTAYEHDWLLQDSRWFLFGAGRYDYDDFKAWDHRIAGSAGVGYELFESDFFELRSRVGFGFSQTFGGETKTSGEMRVGLESLWNITEHQNLSLRGSYFPDLSHTPEFRTTATLEWNVALVDVTGLGLKIGLLHEYESDTLSASGHDLRYYGNLGYDF